jgi:hypothetical protein
LRKKNKGSILLEKTQNIRAENGNRDEQNTKEGGRDGESQNKQTQEVEDEDDGGTQILCP